MMTDLIPSNPGEDLTLSALVQAAADLGSVDEALEDLTPDQVAWIVKSSLMKEMTEAVGARIKTARIDLDGEAESWLSSYQSRSTRINYRRALDLFLAWCKLQGIDPLGTSALQADDWIKYLADGKSDADTVRNRADAISSFFSFVERRHPGIKNPIRGTKARPKKTIPLAKIPTAKEITAIIHHTASRGDADLAAALVLVDETGLRIGALPGLSIRPNGTYTTTSKGKAVLARDPLPDRVLTELAPLGRRPFSQYQGARKIEALKMRLRTACQALKQAGKIDEVYSFHDLRHAFAERNKDKGLYWLARALGHSSVSVTEIYLQNSLGIDPRSIEGQEGGR